MDTTLEVGPLNIEGNSIWPCFSDRSLTRRGSFSHEPNLRSCFNGHASLVLPRRSSSHCSYRVAGCQGLGPVQLRALIHPQLGMLGVLGAGMRGAEVERWEPAHRCRRALTLWRVGGRRGIDLWQGGVAAAGAGLLRGAPLWKRSKWGAAMKTLKILKVRGVNKVTSMMSLLQLVWVMRCKCINTNPAAGSAHRHLVQT